LALDSPAIRGSHFSDLLSRITGTQELDIELSLADSKIHCLKWTFSDVPQLRTHTISSFSVLDSKGIEQMFAGKFNFELAMDNMLKRDYDVQEKGNNITYNILKFKGLLPTFVNSPEPKLAHLETIIKQCQQLKGISTRVQWLSSVRDSPLRYNQFQGAAPKHLEPNGGGAADILAFDQNLILPKVSRWYEDNLQQKIVIEKHSDIFQIKLQPLDSVFRINIVDAGEGLIQALPVLVAGAKASQNEIDFLAIEEPESHLHPRHHAALAAHFCELARQDNPPKLLLETHSENFLLRVQLEIAQRKLEPELVIVYWVRQLDDERSIAEPITFNKLGQPEDHNWPRGVFSENLEQKREILEAQRRYS
jgi:hypothetical protein